MVTGAGAWQAPGSLGKGHERQAGLRCGERVCSAELGARILLTKEELCLTACLILGDLRYNPKAAVGLL